MKKPKNPDKQSGFFAFLVFFRIIDNKVQQSCSIVRIVKFLSILVFFVGIAFGGYYLYKEFFQSRKNNGLGLIASDAIFVFETENPVNAWQTLFRQAIWPRFSEIPSVSHAAELVTALDSLVRPKGNLEDFLKGHRMTISMHPIGKEDFDLMFTLSLSELEEESFIAYLEQNLPELSQINVRNYSNVTIKEFQSLNLERNFTYAKVNKVWVGSFTSFLVEEAIRNFQSNNLENFRDAHKELFADLPDPKGLGVFRLGSTGFSRLFEVISRGRSDNYLVRDLAKNKLSANLHLGVEDGSISFSGKAFLDGKPLVTGKNEGPLSQVFLSYISNRTAAFWQYHLKDIKTLKYFQNVGFQPKNTLRGDVEKNLLEEGFLEPLTGEIAYLLFEKAGTEAQDKVILLRSQDAEKQIKKLKAFNQGLEKADLSLTGHDYYLDQEVFVIGAEEFPSHLLDGKFQGFDDTYVTNVQDMLVFASSSKAIKLFLDDYKSGNTWAKTPNSKMSLESLSSEAPLSFLVNIPKFWSTLVDYSSPNWKAFFQKYGPQFQALDHMQMQLQEDASLQILFSYSAGANNAVKEVLLTENRFVVFPESLTFGPKAIQNFNDNSIEFVVQDAGHQLHLLTEEGEVVFAKTLDGPVVTEVFQVDFYKNGKLQLLFATGSQLYLIDRFGNMLPGFPVKFEEEEIEQLSLVDYDNNKEYRYFLSTASGNLWLLDKNGKSLEGWNPKKLGARAAVRPSHHRIAGLGDRMVLLGQSGELFFFNRRGEPELGSPIKLGDGVETSYVLLERGSAKETRLVTVTTEGEVVQVNFQGELTYRNQLLRPDKNSRFELVKDQKDDRYLILVMAANKLTVMDPDYKELFTKSQLSEDMEFQLFSFGADKNIFVAIDKTQEFIYLYNLLGELLNAVPISGTQKVELKYIGSQNEFRLYVTNGNRFSEYKLPL